MEWILTIVTIVAGAITIIWFARDVRKENSKVLKSISQTQEKALDIEKYAIEIQKEGFETLAEI